MTEFLIHNARGFPDGTPVAVLMHGDRIAWIGANDQAPTCPRRLDAGGAVLLPGFVESHLHIFLGGTSLSQLNLARVTDPAGFAQALTGFAAGLAPGDFLCGYGANYEMLGPGTRPDRHAIDRIIADRPVFLVSTDCHAAWANTRALEMAGILRGVRTPAGSEVVMGPDGLATGELREGAAMDLVRRLTPAGGRESAGLIGREPAGASTPAERVADKAAMMRALAHCASHGITTAANMDGNLYQADLLTEMAGDLPIRVRLPMNLAEDQSPDRTAALIARAGTAATGRLEFGLVKMFMDGVFDTWTAHVIGGYPGQPDRDGGRLISAEAYARLCTAADAAGLQIATHAVGDGAVRAVLDGYEAARAANGARDARHRVEHIDTIHPDDLPRLRALGVTASMQPVHPPGSAGLPLEPTISIMGRARWPTAFPWRRIVDQGTPLAFGTDWPISPIDPLYAIHCALRRQPWAADLPDQRLTLAECLMAYSANGAYLAFGENRFGALRPGLAADLVLVRGALDELAEEAPDVKVVLTVAAGRIVHRAEGWGDDADA